MSAGEEDGASSTKTPTVDPDEILVRQIKVGGGRPLFFDETRAAPPFVDRSLFLPSPNDVDGLSLIRLRYRSDVWAAFRSNTPDQRYRLARLLPSALIECARSVGIEWLHFSPSPDELDREHGEPWAHCNVQEIKRKDYENKSDRTAKDRILAWANAVSTSVTLADVSSPFPPPDPAHDRYRPAAE